MKWISVEDELPSKNGFYLVFFPYKYERRGQTLLPVKENIIEILRWYKNRFGSQDLNLIYPITSITHWMPLPKPPKEEE